MNTPQFIENGKNVLEFLGHHFDNIADLNAMPLLEPGYLKHMLPSEAPLKGENFKDILDDVKTKIVPGIVNWTHPNFYAYFPIGNSYSSILGELLSSGLGGIAFSWVSSPAFTELENIALEWFAKAIHLPEGFYTGTGGGVMQGSASVGVLICLMTARDRAIRQLKQDTDGDIHDSVFLSQLVVYTSSMAHSSIEKAAKMALVKLRIVDVDSHGRMDIGALREAIQKDKDAGLTPFFVVATVGTTAACSFDNIKEIGQVCKETPSIWFHVDGAYAGASFILPEMRNFMNGIDLADSFISNPHKLLLVNFDASCMYVKDVACLKSVFSVNPLYLQHDKNGIDYRDYGIALSRRFRALKLWFVFRTYGIRGIQRYMRNHCALAKRFEKHVQDDDRFEVMNDVHVGLVCFRLQNSEMINRDLLIRINLSGQYHFTPSIVSGKFVIRFCLTYEHANEELVDQAWAMIQKSATYVLVKVEAINHNRRRSSIHEPALDKKLMARLSFTRSVSKEEFDQHNTNNSLTDFSSPIMVIETDEHLNNDSEDEAI